MTHRQYTLDGIDVIGRPDEMDDDSYLRWRNKIRERFPAKPH